MFSHHMQTWTTEDTRQEDVLKMSPCCSSVKASLKVLIDQQHMTLKMQTAGKDTVSASLCPDQSRSAPAMIISQLMGCGMWVSYLPPNTAETPRLVSHLSAPMCENVCDNGEADTYTPTHTYTKETNTTGYIVMIYKIKKSILCTCVCISMFSYHSAVAKCSWQWQRAHLIYFLWIEH